MKRPKKQPPANAPDDTAWFGGAIEWFSVSLLVYPSQLPLASITQLLGCEPTDSQEKGAPRFRPDGSAATPRKVTMWCLKLSPEDTDESDVCEAARLMLAQVNPDVEAWREITNDATARLSFGLTLNAANRGFALDVELLRYLADRGIEADFDIYAEDFDSQMEGLLSQPDPTSH